MVNLELFTVRSAKVSGSQGEDFNYVLRYYRNTFLYQCHKNIWEEDHRNYLPALRKKIIGRNRAD